jgi:hypothetical protein
MKKSHILSIVIFFIGGFCLYAQNASSNGKALNFPFKKYGISIGNSYEFTGIRINFADSAVKRINGLNVTFWLRKFKNYSSAVNGISIGIIPTGGSMQLINIGILGLGTSPKNLNGLSLGGFLIGAGGNINGFTMSGLIISADGDESKISGITIAGIGLAAAKTVNGLAIGGLGVISDGNINGVATSLTYLSAEDNFCGIGVTPGYLKSELFKGVSIACYSKTNQMFGLSIALYNRTNELHGLQLGVLNYAGNNKKGLKMLPIINMHLRKIQ